MKSLVRFRHLPHKLALLPVLLFGVGCQTDGGTEMTADEREHVIQEITGLVDAYADAIANWDMEAINDFWGDSESFVFAGDGVILGGHDEWSETLRQYSEQVDRWLKVEFHNMHVAALSRDAATATAEFEHSWITVAGDTVNTRGAWTYVFKWSDGKWHVVHTNGTHVEF